MTPPYFKIFLEYQLRIITVWPGTYFPEEDITICHCPRKKYCPSPAKHPMYSKWYDTTPPENTSTTISQIENSNCNFAIVTGVLPNNPEKQLVIIDIDDIPRNMEFISKLPRTVTISTPRDGLHFYYILPSTIPVKNLSTGFVDLRGERGYALCPLPNTIALYPHLSPQSQNSSNYPQSPLTHLQAVLRALIPRQV